MRQSICVDHALSKAQVFRSYVLFCLKPDIYALISTTLLQVVVLKNKSEKLFFES